MKLLSNRAGTHSMQSLPLRTRVGGWGRYSTQRQRGWVRQGSIRVPTRPSAVLYMCSLTRRQEEVHWYHTQSQMNKGLSDSPKVTVPERTGVGLYSV